MTPSSSTPLTIMLWRSIPTLFILGLGALACSDSTSNNAPRPPVNGLNVDANYRVALSLQSATFSCEYDSVFVALLATDSATVHASFGGGRGFCSGHGLSSADTLSFAPANLAVFLLPDAKIRILRPGEADTLTGQFSEDLQTITGTAVMRGILATDGFHYTIRGSWHAVRESTP